MGALAALDKKPCSSCEAPLPESLRFGDDNPLTGMPYSESWFRDLPDFAATVVLDVLHLTPGQWDAMVEDREVAEWVDLDTAYRLIKPDVFEVSARTGTTWALTGQAALNEWASM